MKSIPFGAGNVKLKGKKSCNLNCGCCVALNFKDEVEEKFKDQEIEEFQTTEEEKDETN